MNKKLVSLDQLQFVKNYIDSQKIEQKKTFGVRFYGSATTGTRIYDAVGLQANIGYKGENPINDFDEMPIYKDMEEIEKPACDNNGTPLLDAQGNEIKLKFIKIPNFYFGFKKGTDGTGEFDEFVISNYPHAGLVHIFADNVKYALVGKYHTCPIPNNETLYGSVSGANPRVNVSQYALNDTMATFYLDGTKLKPNSSESKLVWDAIAYLFLIEFANRNCQSILSGISSESWTNPVTDATVGSYNAGKTGNTIVVSTSKSEAKADRVTIYGLTGKGTTTWKEFEVTNKVADSPSAGLTTLTISESVTFPASGTCYICASSGGITGKTDNVEASSGYELERTNALATGLRHMKYRGIEDVYGSLWNILCDYAYKITYDGTTYIRQTIKRGENQSKTSPNDWAVVEGTNWSNNDGYVKSINVKGNSIVSEVTTGGSSSTYYSDYYYIDAPTTATNYRCFLAGGDGSSGAADGLFYFYCSIGFTYPNYSYVVRSFLYIV